jgi:prolyl oligopeptidase
MTRCPICLAGLVFVGVSPMLSTDSTLRYPAARIDNVVEKIHGVEVADPYRWLEDSTSPEVRSWVDQENVLTHSILDRLPCRPAIRARLGELLDVGTIGAPTPRKGRYFYTKRAGKQNQSVLYVREGLRGPDHVLVDPNEMAADGTVALDWWYPSSDGRLVAYGVSKNGSEHSTLHIRDVSTGRELADTIDRTRYCSLAWLPDASAFYYTRYPAAGSVPASEENYHVHVYFHQLGADPEKDPKVFGAGRPAEDMPVVQLSPDGRWLAVTEEQGWAKSEVFLKDLQASSGFVALAEKVNAVYEPIVRNDAIYLRTNHGASRYRVYRVDPSRPERANWSEVISEGEDVLESFAAVGEYIVGLYMHDASSRLRVFDRLGKALREVKLPALGSIAGLSSEWDGHEVLFGFQSITIAPSIYHVDLPSEKMELWQRLSAPIEESAYEVEQVRYSSRDGTPITMFLAHRKGLAKDGRNPTLLTGYGGFNVNLTPGFAASRFVFLDQGGVLAIPNLRGGGEYGEAWHQAGMLAHKQKVFDDFIAAARWLVDHRYTNPEKLAIQGGSNGGLLVGAALTQAPELFRAVVCAVPLLDMVRYHKFLIARLWIPEYGSAEDREQFAWLYAYSPYHHVRSGTAYPAVLLEAAESDSRVDALHARKMTARLQAATSSYRPILLRIETRAGHGAGKPRTKLLNEQTDTWSFLFWQLGVDPAAVQGDRKGA